MCCHWKGRLKLSPNPKGPWCYHEELAEIVDSGRQIVHAIVLNADVLCDHILLYAGEVVMNFCLARETVYTFLDKLFAACSTTAIALYILKPLNG